MNNFKGNPQVEDGYTKVANELLGAFMMCPFNGSEFRVLLTVLRKTYGWNKTMDFISFSQISRASNLDLRYVKRIIKRLVKDNVLIKKQTPRGNILGLNKSYYTWRLWISKVSSNLKATREGGKYYTGRGS